MNSKIYIILAFCCFLACKKEDAVVVYQNQQSNLLEPELTYPQNNTRYINCNSVTFKWKPVPSAKKYQLLIASDSSFQIILKDFLLNNEVLLPPLDLRYTYSELNSPILRKTFYWKVRVIDSLGNPSDYSNFRTVYCVSNLDVKPIITNSPSDLIVNDPYQYIPTVTWEKDSNVVSYEIFGSFSDNFVDKSNDQNFNFNITSGNYIKKTFLTDNFYKLNIYALLWNDTLQFIVRGKFADGTYSKWSLTNVIIKDPQIHLFIGDYQVKMKNGRDTTTISEVVNVSKLSETYISLSIPSKGKILDIFSANYYHPSGDLPNPFGKFSMIVSGPSIFYIHYMNFKSEDGKMTMKGSGENFIILSGYRL